MALGKGDFTILKQEQQEAIMRMHRSIASGAIRRWGGRYAYVEMNAGPGVVSTNPDYRGTALRAVPLVLETFPDAEVVLCDIDYAACRSLQYQLEATGVCLDTVSIRRGNHNDIIPRWVGSLPLGDTPYGVLFHDPNGVPEFILLSRLSTDMRLRRLDFMIYLGATIIKRQRAHGVSPLEKQIRSIHKRFWLIREPEGKHQWTFVVGTNWDGFPEWKRAGFHRLESPRGQEILELLSDTRSERFARYQPRLEIPG